ncbi:hypothetical protein CFOL_v3_03934 [Cephalotus follicularis]|uniref:Uncharacterized protein n=1 Tax=Cephalotus follicularis TaxID=3775 RepID=A0A1Q3AXX2_CEPFO|nr:hypothetical protein CFOL_v3_03934 [Cephalotus follicularis]
MSMEPPKDVFPEMEEVEELGGENVAAAVVTTHVATSTTIASEESVSKTKGTNAGTSKSSEIMNVDETMQDASSFIMPKMKRKIGDNGLDGISELEKYLTD